MAPPQYLLANSTAASLGGFVIHPKRKWHVSCLSNVKRHYRLVAYLAKEGRIEAIAESTPFTVEPPSYARYREVKGTGASEAPAASRKQLCQTKAEEPEPEAEQQVTSPVFRSSGSMMFPIQQASATLPHQLMVPSHQQLRMDTLLQQQQLGRSFQPPVHLQSLQLPPGMTATPVRPLQNSAWNSKEAALRLQQEQYEQQLRLLMGPLNQANSTTTMNSNRPNQQNH